jgi:hypothetical protein
LRWQIALSSSQSPDEELPGGDLNPGFGARDRRFEILCQAAVSIEPREGSFDHPAAGQQLKASRVSGAFDDLDGPLAGFGECLAQVEAVVDTVGEKMASPGKQLVHGLDDKLGAITILDISGVHLGTDQQTASIGNDVALAAHSLRWGRLLIFLAASYPRGPPLSVVLTDWVSMTPADGLASRPAASRACSSNSKLIFSNTPPSRQS